ncbi:MAG: universal stress protein [Actinobacteria bacterium]|nr:universal stress protein [Actinomycetota bacterium]
MLGAEEVDEMFEKILVAVDGSESADKAVALTVQLAGAMGSEVTVMHVREVEIGRFHGALEAPADALAIASAVVDRLAEQGIVAKAEVRSAPFGRAAAEIVDEAQQGGFDAIVMGSRGLSDWAASFVGSVAHKVINLAHCPVVIAR